MPNTTGSADISFAASNVCYRCMCKICWSNSFCSFRNGQPLQAVHREPRCMKLMPAFIFTHDISSFKCTSYRLDLYPSPSFSTEIFQKVSHILTGNNLHTFRSKSDYPFSLKVRPPHRYGYPRCIDRGSVQEANTAGRGQCRDGSLYKRSNATQIPLGSGSHPGVPDETSDQRDEAATG